MRLECLEVLGDEPVTLQAMKDYLRVDGDEENPLLESLIAAARGYCEEYTRRSFVRKRLRLVLAPDEIEQCIELPRSKYLDGVESVKEVMPDGAELPVLFEGVRCGDINQKLVLSDIGDIEGDLFITYVVGSETASDYVKVAIRLLVASWYENRLPYNDKSVNEVPFGIRALLNRERVMM